jgi:hypothetical protein
VRVGADVARRGQRKAAGARRATVPWWPASYGRDAAPLDGQRRCCAALSHERRPATARRAKRALEVVCRASPHRAGGAVSVLRRVMRDTSVCQVISDS